jgi:hypothetical protein
MLTENNRARMERSPRDTSSSDSRGCNRADRLAVGRRNGLANILSNAITPVTLTGSSPMGLAIWLDPRRCLQDADRAVVHRQEAMAVDSRLAGKYWLSGRSSPK